MTFLPEISDYLKTQHVCVLAVEMPDGAPHAATLHFAHTPEPLQFYFETNKKYRKSEALLSGKEVRASVVVGVTEADMRTFQMDGIVKPISTAEHSLYEKTYYGKFPAKGEKANLERDVRCVFTPTWWRFTDFTHPDGKRIITSTDDAV